MHFNIEINILYQYTFEYEKVHVLVFINYDIVVSSSIYHLILSLFILIFRATPVYRVEDEIKYICAVSLLYWPKIFT